MAISTAAAILGGSAISALAGGDGGASDAAEESANAQKYATDIQKQMYDQTRADNEPWRQGGNSALQRLLLGLGLSNGTGYSAGTVESRDAIYNRLKDAYTVTSGDAAFDNLDPNNPQDRYQLAQEFANLRDESGKLLNPSSWNGEEGIGPFENWLQYRKPKSTTSIDANALNAAVDEEYARQQALAGQASTDPFSNELMRKFSAADMEADPVYQSGLEFGLNEGTKGLNRQAAAGGSYLSGAALKALTRYGNDYGSTKANESYNRYTSDQNSQYNKLASTAGLGQVANSANQTAGTNYANSVGNYAMTNGANQGNAALAAGNARGSAWSGIGNALGNAAYSWANTPATRTYSDAYSDAMYNN